MRAFVTAAVACSDPDRLVAIVEALAGEVTGADEFVMRDDACDVLVQAQLMQANMSFY